MTTGTEGPATPGEVKPPATPRDVTPPEEAVQLPTTVRRQRRRRRPTGAAPPLPRDDVVGKVRDRNGLRLCGAGVACPGRVPDGEG